MKAKMSVFKISLTVVVTFALLGCTFRPTIFSAHSYRVANNEIIEVHLNSREASVLKARQMYFSLVIIDCEGKKSRFPMEPYIAGQKASEFNFPIISQDVKITGSVPDSIFSQYRKPCVMLEGSSYFSGGMASAPIVIMKKNVK